MTSATQASSPGAIRHWVEATPDTDEQGTIQMTVTLRLDRIDWCTVGQAARQYGMTLDEVIEHVLYQFDLCNRLLPSLAKAEAQEAQDMQLLARLPRTA